MSDKVLNSLIQYFTPFFWFCLFPFTVYIGREFVLPFHLKEKLYLLYITNRRFQQMIFWLKSLFLIFLLLRASFLLVQNWEALFFPSNLFCMLPHERAPLEIPEGDVTQDQLWNELDRRSQLATSREILKSHERIGEHIRELRRQEGMRLPGGFQTERLVEMLEERYGGEQMLEIERDIMQHGVFSRFYNETKTYFNDFRREHVTEALLRKEWQGKE